MMPLTDININDVLLGRNRISFNHLGNHRFRQLIASYQDEYLTCTKRQEKALLMEKVEKMIRSKGGRFLKFMGNTGEWEEAPVRTVKEKIAHAFRDSTANIRKLNLTTAGVTTKALSTSKKRPLSASPRVPTKQVVIQRELSTNLEPLLTKSLADDSNRDQQQTRKPFDDKPSSIPKEVVSPCRFHSLCAEVSSESLDDFNNLSLEDVEMLGEFQLVRSTSLTDQFDMNAHPGELERMTNCDWNGFMEALAA